MPMQALTPSGLAARAGEPAKQDCGVYLNSESVHDLSGPINQLCSMADLIFAKYGETLDADAELLFGFVRSSAARLQNLLGGLKTHFEIMEAPTSNRRCSAEDLLTGALASLQPKIEEAGAVVTHDPLPDLECDPNQITFVFASLIDNAIKFRGREAPRVHITADSTGRGWTISVRDNGMGIDPRHHESIFGVFKRVHKDEYPGAGMGLAIVKRIMERHNGHVRIESVPEEGTTVIIELPER
jgi:chemotaxis family two-component system sensor kinase Cph1